MSEDEITLAWTDPKEYYDLVKGYQQALDQAKEQVFINVKEAANNVLSDVSNWMKNIF